MFLRTYIGFKNWGRGQGSFRFAVEQAYQQCAVTKEHSIPALESAHIKPYSLGGFHEVNNGLLLRADIHKLECTPQK
jgi:putative restriction endonuclease